MDQTVSLSFGYDRNLWRRAMTGWWRSVVPSAPFAQRVIFWAIVWFGIALLAGAITMFGLTPAYVLAGLVGAGCLVAVFAYLQRTRMSRFWDVVGQHWDRAGHTEAIFGPEGVMLQDDVSSRQLSWQAIDAIAIVRGGTVLRSGISMTVIPDEVLPEGLDAKTFRSRISAWRAV